MTMKRLRATALAAAVCLFSPIANAEELVAQFSGDSSGKTAEFSVEAPWIMDWRVTGEQGQYEVIEMGLVNAISGAYEGAAVRSKAAGNGVRLFETGGRYYFRVDTSLMHWEIKVIQLTAQEAEQYKPVAPPGS